jgi:eukaryotic-like serine/threonine-protein kinase
MDSERWKQVESLFQAAWERAPDERDAFLRRACRGDDSLRREVELLLAEARTDQGLQDLPVLRAADLLPGDSETLKPGKQIGPYRIEGVLGAGGMGTVYRATDTRLDRPVAIKISKSRFDERFEREARAISSLNHPHICTLHDIGPDYMVMELVEGETMAARIRKGALPVGDVLRYGAQIAGALDAAHDKNITHRDLKPANVMIAKNGVKVLDFGLAKCATHDGSLTLTGVVMGTPAYMAPEQLEGKEADARTDIFALGLTLYEMATGKRVAQDQPTAMDGLPERFTHVVERCLEREPENRWQSARDVKAELDWAADRESSDRRPGAAASALPPKRTWLWVAAAVMGLAIAGLAVGLWAPWRKPAVPAQVLRFEVWPPEKTEFIRVGGPQVSPDGRWIVFLGRGQDGANHFYLRSLDGEVRVLPDTVETSGGAYWSRDSRWLVFADGGKLKKVDVRGEPPQDIADFSPFLFGASWNSDDVIIAGAGGGAATPILRVPASGGQATPVTAVVPGEIAHAWPQFLPDGKHFLYLRISNDAAKMGVYIGSIDLQPKQQSMQRLLATNHQALYASSPGGGNGHLIFLREARLMAQPFDPDNMTLSGEPTAIADGVDSFDTVSNQGLFSVSDTGTLVYRAGGSQSALTWFDPLGNPAGTLGHPSAWSSPAISPDGSRVAVAMGPEASRNIWILDVARGNETRFTFGPGRDDYPAWSPDGRNVAFSSNRAGQMNLYIKPADGSSEEKLLFKTDEPKVEERWTRDGRYLLFESTGPKTNGDVWALPFPGDAKPVPLVQTLLEEGQPRPSPDGRWLAYSSLESSALEVWVRPFIPEAPAGTGAKWLVSKGGGWRSIWRQDAKALFYLSLTSQAMAVDIDTSKGFQAGAPRLMFTAPPGAGAVGWDMSPDGKRFLLATPLNTGRATPFTVLVNWAAGLKK